MRFQEFERAWTPVKGAMPPAPKPVYLFFGAENHLKQAGVARLRAALGLRERETRLDGAEATPDALLGEVFTLSFFGGGAKLVVLDGTEPFFSKYETTLKKAFANPPAGPVLAMLAGKLPAHSKLIKWADSMGAAVECKPLEETERVPWILARAKARGKPMARAAAELLAQKVDGGLDLLAGHVENLALYAAARPEIGRSDVEALVGTDRSFVVFDLVKEVANRHKGRAIEILHRLLRDAEGIEAILGALAWQFRQLLQAELILRSGGTRAQVSEKLKLRGFFESQFYERLGRFRPGELHRKHRLLGRFDLMAKTSAMPPDALAELLVLQLMEA